MVLCVVFLLLFHNWHLKTAAPLPWATYSRKGSRFSVGVVPRDVRRCMVELKVGSAELFRGVCMPEGVELPLMFRLQGEVDKIS